MTDADLAAAAPGLILAGGAVVATLLSIPVGFGVRVVAWLGAAASIASATAAVAIGPSGGGAFGGTVARDSASVFFLTLIGLTVAGTLVLAAAGPPSARRSSDEVALVLFSACGAALVVSAADLLVLVAGLALLTVPLYALSAGRRAREANDRAVRHLLNGAASSAAALYGVALLYSATGETGYAGLGRATHNPLYLAGLALALVGLAFHLVLAPARRSTVVVNLAMIGALLRLIAATRSGDVALDWEVSLATLAAVALAVAALGALTERRVRTLVAYATISQLGYVAVAAAGSAVPAAVFALATYAVLALGLFGVTATLPHDEPRLEDLAGLWRRRPVLVLALGVVVLGLIGLPPTAGFLAKVYVFEAAVRAQLLWLVVLAALAAVATASSYVRIVLACIAPPRLDAVAPSRGRAAAAVVVLSALAIVAVGVVPGPLLDAAQAVRF
jgi:NADH-quinone oxidoreductase subunit N